MGHTYSQSTYSVPMLPNVYSLCIIKCHTEWPNIFSLSLTYESAICLSIILSIYLSTYPCLCLSIFLSLFLSVNLSINTLSPQTQEPILVLFLLELMVLLLMREALSWTRRGSSMHLWSPSRQPGQACHPSTGKSQFHQPSDSSGLTIAGRSPKIVITCLQGVKVISDCQCKSASQNFTMLWL